MAEKKKYKSRFSGLQHDEATNAIVNKVLEKFINSKPNPNLLDNWYFLNPVNHRGVTESTKLGYTVDRWYRTSYGTLKVTADGLQLIGDNTNGPLYLRQFLENPPPAGEYTLSILASDVVGAPTLYVYYLDDNGEDKASNAVTLVNGLNACTFSNVSIGRVQLTIPVNARVTLKAIKLELGGHQTLAHQDDSGNWVLNEIPDYSEQLRKCQRYFWKVSTVHAFGYTYSSSTAYANFTPPAIMRATPAVVIDEENPPKFNIRCNGTLYENIAAGENVYMGDNAPQIRLSLAITDLGLTKGISLSAAKASGSLAFSADL